MVHLNLIYYVSQWSHCAVEGGGAPQKDSQHSLSPCTQSPQRVLHAGQRCLGLDGWNATPLGKDGIALQRFVLFQAPSF